MSLKYEPSSEPLHNSAKQLFLNGAGGEQAVWGRVESVESRL